MRYKNSAVSLNDTTEKKSVSSLPFFTAILNEQTDFPDEVVLKSGWVASRPISAQKFMMPSYTSCNADKIIQLPRYNKFRMGIQDRTDSPDIAF